MQRYHSNESVVGAVASNWRGSEDSKGAYRLGGGGGGGEGTDVVPEQAK